MRDLCRQPLAKQATDSFGEETGLVLGHLSRPALLCGCFLTLRRQVCVKLAS
jgi:hypothetical protein